MRRRYRGRRRSGKLFLLLAAVLVIAAVIVVAVVQNRNRHAAPDDPAVDPGYTEPVNRPDDGEKEDPNPDGEEQGGDVETDPEPIGYARIEVQGEQQRYDAVYRVGDTGFEMYTYVPEIAARYAAAVTAVADELSGAAAVYAMAIPLSSGITLPDDLAGMDIFGDQQAAGEQIAAAMGANVRPVPLYDVLMQHRTEYLYYRTDHHWTGLGAYYAYCRFCQEKGITPHQLTDYAARDFDGFLGTFYNDSGNSPELGEHPDVVTAYYPIANAPMTVTDQKGKTVVYGSAICDESTAPAGFKYGAYIYGDNPFTVLENQTLTDGSACVVVKESFGNALVPFLVDHYQTVYVVDYRYWSGDLTDFVREQGVQDVLFINNLSAIRSSYLIGKLQGIL